MSSNVLILRAVLLVIRSAGTHATLTAPTPTPTANERGKYFAKRADGKPKYGWEAVMAQAAVFLKILLHAITVIELFAILFAVTDSPSQLSDFAPPIIRPQPSVTAIIGSLLMGAGGALRVASYRAMGDNYTFVLSIKKDHTLITHGPYSVVRHPGYTAACIFFPGMLFAFIGPGGVFECLDLWRFTSMRFGGVVLVLTTLYLWVMLAKRIPVEDRALQEEFKEKWVAWSKKVPYSLVPYVY